MNKVYIVFSDEEFTAHLVSVHSTEEGAKKECQRLFERCRSKRNPYFYEDHRVKHNDPIPREAVGFLVKDNENHEQK